MAVTNGKLERIIQIPTGDWTFELTESTPVTTPATVTLTAAKTYYWSSAGNDTVDLAAKLKALLDAASPNSRTYTVTPTFGENGAGGITIAVSSGTFEMDTFKENAAANNALRDLLGFSGDLTPTAASHVSDQQCLALWLPDRPYYNRYGSGDWGHEISDVTGSVSPGGDVSIQYSQRYEVMPLEWQGITRAKMRIAGESTTGESFQRVYRNDMLGERGYCAQAGGPFRFYPDAADDATYTTGMIHPNALRKHIPDQLRDRATGWWNIRFDWIVQ